MSELVDHDDIEAIVGADRDPVVHLVRAISAERPEDRRVYVLHSRACLDRHRAGTRDLRDCPFSLALDRGINLGVWGAHQDKPMRAAVSLGGLMPWHPWMTCPTCTGTVRETEAMVCQTCGTDYGAPDEPAPAPDAPPELLVVWAETQDVARAAAWCLGLNARQVIALGNRSADTLRGLSPTRVLILPGACSRAVEQALTISCNAHEEVPVLDLRAVQA